MPWYITSLYIQRSQVSDPYCPFSYEPGANGNISREVRILVTILNSTFIILFWAIQLPRRTGF